MTYTSRAEKFDEVGAPLNASTKQVGGGQWLDVFGS